MNLDPHKAQGCRLFYSLGYAFQRHSGINSANRDETGGITATCIKDETVV